MAAAFMESLLLNHPFIDGNKRAACFVTDVFLRINGYKLSVEPKEAHRFILASMEPDPERLKGLTTWITKHFRKV